MYLEPKTRGIAANKLTANSAPIQSTLRIVMPHPLPSAGGVLLRLVALIQKAARLPKKPAGRSTRVIRTAATETIWDHSIDILKAMMVSEKPSNNAPTIL